MYHDGNNVTLYCTAARVNRKTQEKSISESIIGYYSTFAQAANRLLEEKISDSTATDLRDLKADMAMRLERISKALESQIDKIATEFINLKKAQENSQIENTPTRQSSAPKQHHQRIGGKKPTLATVIKRKSQE